VPRNQKLASSAASEQLNSHEDWSDHDCVNAVDSDSIDRMEIGHGLTGRTAEGNVSADLLHRPARFDASDDISSRQVLVFETYVGLRRNT
jgi:hypothetical protein